MKIGFCTVENFPLEIYRKHIKFCQKKLKILGFILRRIPNDMTEKLTEIFHMSKTQYLCKKLNLKVHLC